MAFDERERQIIEWSKANGKSVEEMKQAILRYRETGSPRPPEQQGDFLSETGQDLLQTGEAIGQQFGQAGEQIVQTAQDQSLNPLQKALQIGSQAFRGGARAFGEGVIGVGKAVLPESAERAVGQQVQEVATQVAEIPQVQDLVQRYESLDPETKRNVDNALGYAEGLAEILTGGVAGKLARHVIKATREAVDNLAQQASKFTIPKAAPQTKLPKATGSLGSDVIRDIIPTRDALRDRFVANSLRLAPVEDLARIESLTGNNVAEFLGRYDLIQNTPDATLESLNKFKQQNYNLVRDAIDLVDQRFTFDDLPQLNDTIDFLIADLAGRKSPEYQQAFQRLSEIKNKGEFDLSEAQYVKSVFDDIESVYKRTGDGREAISAQDKAGTIAPVRRFIEDRVSEQYPEIDIRALNNNVQTARAIGDAVIKRSGKADTASFFRLGDLAVLGAGNFYVPGGGYAAFFGKKIFESAPIQLRFARLLDDWARKGEVSTKGLSPDEIKQINELITKELGEQVDIRDF